MPDQEMIERVAKAMAEKDGQYPSFYLGMAQAAIKAMRGPTEKMVEAGCEGNPTQWNDGTDNKFAADVANDVWQAMIDSILND